MKTKNSKERMWRKLEDFNANYVDEMTQSLGQLVFTASGKIRTRPADVPMAMILSFYTSRGKLLKGAAVGFGINKTRVRQDLKHEANPQQTFLLQTQKVLRYVLPSAEQVLLDAIEAEGKLTFGNLLQQDFLVEIIELSPQKGERSTFGNHVAPAFRQYLDHLYGRVPPVTRQQA